MTAHPLLDATLEHDVGAHLARLGEVFAVIEGHDSGNTSWGVEIDGERWFVKAAFDPRAVAYLQSAVRFHAAVAHPAVVPLCRSLPVDGDGLAVVHPWVDGEILNDPSAPGTLPRDHPDSAHSRFRALPVERIVAALDLVYDAHLVIARAGFVAVDFYDGCIIYDFATGAVHLIDLDLYEPGPYVLGVDRQFGSTRFMAPEEFRRGATIDQRTTVFTLARTAFVFLSRDALGAPDRGLWRGSAAQYEVASQAIRPAPDERPATVAEFASNWRAACRAG